MIHLNRQPNRRGVSHGGVAVLYKDSEVKLTSLALHNPKGYEVLSTVAKLTGQYRRVVVIACYMPPSLVADAARECMALIVDAVHEAKRKFDEPRIVVAGDFNQFKIHEYLEEHPDLKEVNAGPTRGDRRIGLILLIMGN